MNGIGKLNQMCFRELGSDDCTVQGQVAKADELVGALSVPVTWMPTERLRAAQTSVRLETQRQATAHCTAYTRI